MSTRFSAVAIIFASLIATTVVAFAPNVAPRGYLKDVQHGVLSMADTVISEGKPQTQSKDPNQLLTAVKQMDATLVSKLLESGMKMDETTVEAAFWAVVDAVDRAEAEERALPVDVPRMLHHIFDADMQLLLGREKLSTNVTCMKPKDEGLSNAHQMNYVFDDSSHKDLPLTEGRKCDDGRCCEACSRNIFPTFATNSESDIEKFPELSSFTFNNLKQVSTATIIQFTRLIERVRRTMAHEYGLPLSYILPLQAYSRKYVAGTTQQGGGGGEGDFVTLHTDEATHSGYHYSCVIYLSTQGVDFEGGNFVFNDPLDDDDASPTIANKERGEEAVVEEEDEDDDEEAAAQRLLEALLRGEELPDDGSDTAISTDELVDNHWTDDDPEEYEDIEYFNSLKENIRRSGRKLTPFHPTRGSAVIFSSGWENMHEVETITSGVRYAVPCFFTTSPVPDVAYEQMAAGKPKTDEDIADDWLHLLLAHREDETPPESVGRVKELLMKWHYICTPLSQH